MQHNLADTLNHIADLQRRLGNFRTILSSYKEEKFQDIVGNNDGLFNNIKGIGNLSADLINYDKVPFTETAIYSSPTLGIGDDKWSNLAAKDMESLHRIAENIGLKREWFQNTPNGPYYNINTDRFIKNAFGFGVIPVTNSYFFQYVKHHYCNK